MELTSLSNLINLWRTREEWSQWGFSVMASPWGGWDHSGERTRRNLAQGEGVAPQFFIAYVRPLPGPAAAAKRQGVKLEFLLAYLRAQAGFDYVAHIRGDASAMTEAALKERLGQWLYRIPLEFDLGAAPLAQEQTAQLFECYQQSIEQLHALYQES